MIRLNHLLAPVARGNFRGSHSHVPRSPVRFIRALHGGRDPNAQSGSQPPSHTKQSPVAADDPSDPKMETFHAPEAPESVKTEPQKSIPGPTWLWLEPLYTPFRAYGRAHQRRPYLTQFVSTLVIYLVGDFVAQSVSKDDIEDTCDGEKHGQRGVFQAWAEDRDWQRTGRALFIGGLAAVPGYKWFLWLSNSFNYSSKVLSLSVKVVINQSLFTPIFNTYFFGMQHLLSHPFSEISLSSLATHIYNTVPTSWVNSCKLWPAVTAFLFAYVKLEYRSLIAGVVAIGWQTYLSLLDSRARRAERERKNAQELPRLEHEREVDDGAASNEHQCAS